MAAQATPVPVASKLFIFVVKVALKALGPMRGFRFTGGLAIWKESLSFHHAVFSYSRPDLNRLIKER